MYTVNDIVRYCYRLYCLQSSVAIWSIVNQLSYLLFVDVIPHIGSLLTMFQIQNSLDSIGTRRFVRNHKRRVWSVVKPS